MGVHELCSKCQRLSRAGLLPVTADGIPEHRLRSKKFVSYYLFYDRESESSMPLSQQTCDSLETALRFIRGRGTYSAGPEPKVLSEHSMWSMRQTSSEGCHLCTLMIQNGGYNQDLERFKNTELSKHLEWTAATFGIPLLRLESNRQSPNSAEIPTELAKCLAAPGSSTSKLEFVFGNSTSPETFWLSLAVRSSDVASTISPEGTTLHGFYSSTIEKVQNWLMNCRRHPECAHSFHTEAHKPAKSLDDSASPPNGLDKSVPRYKALLKSIFHSERLHTDRRPSDPSSSEHAKQAYTSGSVDHRELPRRLLKIEADDENLRIRLIETCHLNKDELDLEYATLSHCWGDGKIARMLMFANLGSHLEGIPFPELPRTFRESLTLVNLLGIKFMWIDALCIVQDDAEEWRKESSRMLDVYGGAVLNVAATASGDSSGGLLRQQYERNPCRMDTKWDSTSSSLAVDIGTLPSSFNQIDRGPLNARGWVFQERMLSVRSVHFASDQVWFQCRQGTISECSGVGANLPGESRHPFHMLTRDDWHSIVTDFSITKLSRNADKLAAISGLARDFAARHGLKESDYIAGLFKSKLPDQLLWRGTSRSTETITVAPSWSWAARPSGTYIEFFSSQSLERVTQYFPKLHIELGKPFSEPGDPFYYSRFGSLLLRGALCKFSYRANKMTDRTAETIVLNGRLEEIKIGPETFSVLNDSMTDLVRCRTRKFPSMSASIYWDLIALRAQAEQMHFLPIARSGYKDKSGNLEGPSIIYTGILLIRLGQKDKKVGFFSRIGMVDVTHRADGTPHFWTQGGDAEADQFCKSGGDGLYYFQLF